MSGLVLLTLGNGNIIRCKDLGDAKAKVTCSPWSPRFSVSSVQGLVLF